MRIKAIALGIAVAVALPLAGAYARSISQATIGESGAGFYLSAGIADSDLMAAHRSRKASKSSHKSSHHKSRKHKSKKSGKSKKSDYSKSR